MKKIIAAFLVSLILAGCSSSEQELYIFCWVDYIAPEVIEEFEKEYHCTVILDTFDSNESMYAKLKLSATPYDLIIPSSYFVQLMQNQGMLQPINLSAIPNIKFLDPLYRSESDYDIPFSISFTGIAYRKDKVSDFDSTWNIFARKDLKGRMTMLNDIREVFGAALRYLGYSINTTNETEINEAANLIISWKKNLAKFENEQYKNGIASAEYLVVQGYNGDILQVMQEHPQVAFVLPKEGTTFSSDNMVIPFNAENVQLAEQFINFLLEPKIAYQNMLHTQFTIPNTGAYEMLSPEMRQNPAIFPPASILDKIEKIKDIGPAIVLYNRAWDRIKASD